MGAIGDFIGGVFDTVGSLFGSGNSNAAAQTAALQAQQRAQEQSLKLQQRQQQQNLAMQQQQMKKANAQNANAAAAISNTPTVTNPSNLTGGLGVDPADLILGSNSLLGGKKSNTEDQIL